MNIKEYLERQNEMYKAIQKETGQKPDMIRFNRQALLNLNNVQCSEKELLKFINVLLDNKIFSQNIEAINRQLKEKFLLSLSFRNDKPEVKEVYSVWFDMDSHFLYTAYPISFEKEIHAIKIDDYREIDENIRWYDIV